MIVIDIKGFLMKTEDFKYFNELYTKKVLPKSPKHLMLASHLLALL